MPNPTKKELEAQTQELAAKISGLIQKGKRAKEELANRANKEPISQKEMLKAEIQILKQQLANLEAKIQRKV